MQPEGQGNWLTDVRPPGCYEGVLLLHHLTECLDRFGEGNTGGQIIFPVSHTGLFPHVAGSSLFRTLVLEDVAPRPHAVEGRSVHLERDLDSKSPKVPPKYCICLDCVSDRQLLSELATGEKGHPTPTFGVRRLVPSQKAYWWGKDFERSSGVPRRGNLVV